MLDRIGPMQCKCLWGKVAFTVFASCDVDCNHGLNLIGFESFWTSAVRMQLFSSPQWLFFAFHWSLFHWLLNLVLSSSSGCNEPVSATSRLYRDLCRTAQHWVEHGWKGMRRIQVFVWNGMSSAMVLMFQPLLGYTCFFFPFRMFGPRGETDTNFLVELKIALLRCFFFHFLFCAAPLLQHCRLSMESNSAQRLEGGECFFLLLLKKKLEDAVRTTIFFFRFQLHSKLCTKGWQTFFIPTGWVRVDWGWNKTDVYLEVEVKKNFCDGNTDVGPMAKPVEGGRDPSHFNMSRPCCFYFFCLFQEIFYRCAVQPCSPFQRQLQRKGKKSFWEKKIYKRCFLAALV